MFNKLEYSKSGREGFLLVELKLTSVRLNFRDEQSQIYRETLINHYAFPMYLSSSSIESIYITLSIDIYHSNIGNS